MNSGRDGLRATKGGGKDFQLIDKDKSLEQKLIKLTEHQLRRRTTILLP